MRKKLHFKTKIVIITKYLLQFLALVEQVVLVVEVAQLVHLFVEKERIVIN